MVRKYKKRTYKPRKRTYKRRYYKRRYYKRRYKPIKKPEIHIAERSFNVDFDNAINGVGTFLNVVDVGQVNSTAGDYDDVEYTLSGKPIEGKKVRLKYLYIKGYILVQTTVPSQPVDVDDFNCKLIVFRWKRNTSNYPIEWSGLINNPPAGASSTWTPQNRLDMLYMKDWKNDIKINFYKKVKNLYRKYDDANNIIPFKMRIPLYDCVLTCDSYKNSSTGYYTAYPNPSTNGLYFTFLSNKYDATTTIHYKTKLYYTDY